MVGVKLLLQSNIGGSITLRCFLFFNDKLYRVIVAYEYDSVIFEGIVNKLVTDYGLAQSKSAKDSDDIWLKWHISSTTNILLEALDNAIKVDYINPYIYDEVNDLMKKKKQESIKF